ncbi:hypothetical protein [Dactylosporangium sp. AC04546]|uniref:hypothetical protein n=1 Tax=Dactylosporangium sp. AC04546 TaxID=2862460 RepID=UPI003FA45CA4
MTAHRVNFHLRQIFAKLKIDSRIHLARLVKFDPRQRRRAWSATPAERGQQPGHQLSRCVGSGISCGD